MVREKTEGRAMIDYEKILALAKNAAMEKMPKQEKQWTFEEYAMMVLKSGAVEAAVIAAFEEYDRQKIAEMVQER